MESIISIKNLGKRYNINHTTGGYIALRDILTENFKHPLKFLKSRAKKIAGINTKEEFWALKNINLDIQKGEIIGIIGSNGAGKSTLLKILSQITPPTIGEIKIHGTVGSLLEVGTGFHPELTGRENVFLNGAILGMTKKDIIEKFDKIVEFAGIDKFLDTPVKYYSSGMYVRLAFSVAAHMEPDILIVDEVLAVGDADFQKKCLGKMEDVTKNAGRTVLFVSHNMAAIQSLCQRTILLEAGKIKVMGQTNEVIAQYLENSPLTQEGSTLALRRDRKGKGNVKITSFFVEQNGQRVDYLKTGGFYTFCFGYQSNNNKPLNNVSLAMAISTKSNQPLILNWSKMTNQDFNQASSHGMIRCTIKQKLPLAEDIYNLSVNLFVDNEVEDFIKNLGVFEVKSGNFFGQAENIKHSPIYLEQNWSIE